MGSFRDLSVITKAGNYLFKLNGHKEPSDLFLQLICGHCLSIDHIWVNRSLTRDHPVYLIIVTESVQYQRVCALKELQRFDQSRIALKLIRIPAILQKMWYEIPIQILMPFIQAWDAQSPNNEPPL